MRYVLALLACVALAKSPETVLFMGSSSIVFWEKSLGASFPEIKPVSAGRVGTDYAYVASAALEAIKRHNPDRVVLYSGDNDLARGDQPREVTRNFEKAVEVIRRVKPEMPIYVISIKPSPGRRAFLTATKDANAEIQKSVAKMHKVIYVDVFTSMLDANGEIIEKNFDPTDAMNIHMGPQGYELWSSILRPYLQKKAP